MDDIDKLTDSEAAATNINPAPAPAQSPNIIHPMKGPAVSATSDLPSANELFPPDLPDANDLFPINKDAQRTQQFGTSPIQDLLFGDESVNPIARVLGAIGEGARNQWGTLTKDHLSEEAQTYLKVNKQFDDWEQNQNGIIKAANEALFRPAATALVREAVDAVGVVRGVQSAFAGGMAGVGQIGKEIGDPSLEGQVGAMMDAFPTGIHTPQGMGFHPTAHPALKAINDLQKEIYRANELKVFNEDAYMGTDVSPPISGPQSTGATSAKTGMPVDLFDEPRSQVTIHPVDEAATPAEAAPAKPNPIAEDVAGKLIAAGRPADEADVGGQLSAAFHETRAARFKGAIGTAEDSYHETGSDIRGADPDLPGGERMLPVGDQPKPGGGAGEAIPTPEPKIAEHTPLEDVIAADKKVQAEAEAVAAKDKAVADTAKAKGEPVPAKVEPAEPKPAKLATVTEAGEPIKTVNVKKTLRGRAAADPETWSLFEYLASKGGLKSDPELHAIFGNKKGPMIPGFGPLMRKASNPDAMTLDEALRSAKDGRYMFDPGDVTGAEGKLTPNDLLDLIVLEHNQKQKQYRITHTPEAKPIEPEEEAGHIISHLERELADHNDGHPVHVDPAIKDRVVEIIQKEGGTDVLAAHDRAIQEDFDRHEGALNERQAEIGLADGWDHPYGEPEFAHGEDIAERRGEAGLPDEGSRGADGSEPRTFSEADREPLNEGEGIRPPDAELVYDQRKRGQIRLRDGFRAVITLFKSANASTFIHETGHHWLAQLMQDALHPKAPADLIADAKTVMNWLGVESPRDIKTSHHEKFARGFERYMMEGRAPSKALANVFAKFKAWLTQIYGSVAKLKSPITNDIRGVFDRMLSMPSEIKIEPDPVSHTFADIHATDAAETPPQMAHPVAETAQGERDKVSGAALTGAENDTRLENTPKQREGLPPGNTELGGDANATGADGGEKGDHAPTRTLGEGGVDPTAEGHPASDSPGQPQEVAPPVGNPPPARPPVTQNPQTPHDPFPDKAGNIVLKNLNTPEDLNAILRQSAEDNGDYQYVRGPISDAQVMDLAEAAGMNPALIDMAKLSAKWDAPQIVALRRLLIESSQSVRDLARKAADGAEADVLAYGEATARHRLIQEAVSEVTGHAGRNLRAFQAKFTAGVADVLHLGPVGDSGMTLFQLQKEAKFLSKLQTPGQVSKFVNDTGSGKFRSAVLEYYVNALLSGPITHLRYVASNIVNALWTPLVEIPYAATTGKIAEIKAGQPIDRVRYGEAGAQLYALMKGSRDGYEAAIEAFTSGVSPPLPTERVAAQFAEASRAIPGVPGSIIRVPAKSVASIHSFFKSLRYEQNIAGSAYRIAANEGLTGKAFTDRVADLHNTPSEAMMRDATANALRELYMSPTDYHSAMGGITRAVNNNLAAKIIVPFLKIGSQITRAAIIDKSAIGLLSPKVRATLAAGGADAQFQAARMAAGTSLVAASLGLCMEGMMTGDGPENPQERAVWLMSHTPNSIQIGDMTFRYANTGPLGMLMRTTANLHELTKGNGLDSHGIGVVAAGLLPALAKSVLDETFLRGFKDMLDAVFHFKEYGGRYATSMVTNWIPDSVGLSQIAHKIDPYQRETVGFMSHPGVALMQAAQAKVPWLSEQLMPRRDMFGEPIRWDGPNPDYANDPVVKALDALNGSGIGKMAKKINGIELTEQQYDDVSRIAGRDAKMKLNAMIGIIDNPTVPVGVRIEMIHKAISGSRKMARKLVMIESVGSDNDIMKQSMDAKVGKRTTLAPNPAETTE